ncbi:hypothetical protein L210DRAFT_3560138, partial [Boletus edulis BED1]
MHGHYHAPPDAHGAPVVHPRSPPRPLASPFRCAWPTHSTLPHFVCTPPLPSHPCPHIVALATAMWQRRRH